jgi:CubicO group peptidase (beta-lactamase class C family)
MANGGRLKNTHLLSSDVIRQAHVPMALEWDPVTSRHILFCVGGWGRLEHLVDGETWYGWAGAGGSLMVWNIEHNLAFSYVMNAVRFAGLGDRRSRSLLKEFVRVVKETKRKYSEQY